MGEKVKLKSYFVNLAHGLKPMATLKIEINGKEYEESSSGDGQYDAFLHKCIRTPTRWDRYRIIRQHGEFTS